MSDNIFSNFEQVDGMGSPQDTGFQDPNVLAKPKAEPKIVSKDYENIKPFYTSTYGNSRLL